MKKDFSGCIAGVLKYSESPAQPPQMPGNTPTIPTSTKSPAQRTTTLLNIPEPPSPPANDPFWNIYIKKCANNCVNGVENRYALYVGHLYERKGWHVDYMGYRYNTDGAQIPPSEEPERLICRKGNKVLVIQCKDWVNGGIIHLPFMYRFIALALEYKTDNPTLHVGGKICTNASFSPRAQLAATKFNISLKEKFKFSYFPYVKCKADVDGKNVHYTPYDEDYFHTDINPQNGDTFCWTEQQAIDFGF